MKAEGTVFQNLLNGQIQYRVPLFQRTYSWDESNWQRLWDDLMEAYALQQPRKHFIGAIVTLPMPDSPEHASKFMLIDGQQRLTTLFIILSLLRDAARTDPAQQRLAEAIQEECLINKHAIRDEEREKMRPTQQDIIAFKAAITSQPVDANSRIGVARTFFKDALEKGDLTGNSINLTKLKGIITGYLDFVSVTLDQDDSPHRIFESLNNTGMDLSASDLVRNYVFMSIPTEAKQNAAYNSHWYPMQQRMELDGYSVLTDFFWRFLMKDGALPRYDEVYEGMRDFIQHESNTKSILQILEKLSKYSEYYLKLKLPNPNELSIPIREQLQRLNQWEVDVAYPFMLAAMSKRHIGHITDDALLQVLNQIESYVVRRIVCGIPTNRLRRVFARMNTQVTDENYVESCHSYLKDNEWPMDQEFCEMFKRARIYIPSRLSRTRLILSSLERSYEHHEPIEMTDQITTEHIMPQTLNDEWRQQLGDNSYQVHDKYLHTIGNLTYSGYNSEMGNAPFETKKGVLSQSHFELNKHIIQSETWAEEKIVKRAEELAQRALVIWKRDF